MYIGSLLPKYRGAAPIQWAVLNGDKKTGITTMYMEKGMDTGDMIKKEEVEITREDTTKTMFEKLAIVGKNVLLETLKMIEEGNICREKQDESKATYAPMISKDMGIINFNTSFEEIYNKIRGLNDFLVARIVIQGKIYKIWKAYDKKYNIEEIEGELEKIKRKDSLGNDLEIIISKNNKKKRLFFKCNDGYIEILEIQPESKKNMKVQDFLNSSNIF